MQREFRLDSASPPPPPPERVTLRVAPLAIHRGGFIDRRINGVREEKCRCLSLIWPPCVATENKRHLLLSLRLLVLLRLLSSHV